MFESLVIAFYFALLLLPIIGLVVGVIYFNPFQAQPNESSPDEQPPSAA